MKIPKPITFFIIHFISSIHSFEVTDAVLSRVRSLELELVKAADLASQASAALCESVFAGDAFLALWTDSNDGLGRALSFNSELERILI